LVSSAGYAGWGELTKDNILASMSASYEHLPEHYVVTIALILITAHVVLAFPLPMNPINLAVSVTTLVFKGMFEN
jgi:hypothetical protein